jgi:hypothetical protein
MTFYMSSPFGRTSREKFMPLRSDKDEKLLSRRNVHKNNRRCFAMPRLARDEGRLIIMECMLQDDAHAFYLR